MIMQRIKKAIEEEESITINEDVHTMWLLVEDKPSSFVLRLVIEHAYLRFVQQDLLRFLC